MERYRPHAASHINPLVGASPMAEMTPDERETFRSRFSAAVVHLVEFSAYWCPRRRKIVFRSSIVKRQFSIPPDVVYVGTYREPFPARAFLADLEALLVSTQV